METTTLKCVHILILTLAGILNSAIVKPEEVRIITPKGVLIGETENVEFNGEYKPVTRFLGVPYAKPPIGNRRFMKPEPYGNFIEPYNATFSRPHCIQTKLSYQYIKSYVQSEDCLYLNIYIPGNSSFSTKNYAVMVYIHGGSFVDGGAEIYDGDKLSGFHDTIIVSINYRLNVFGFLSDGITLLGNNGLWDMRLALQWVHDNIGEFGGDPTRVTLFGQSAGGAAVLYQALYPKNRGLFQRIIAQSGSSFAIWAFQKTPLKNFLWFSSSVGCNQTFIDDILQCLREKPAQDLKLDENQYTLQFIPSIDHEFLPEDPVSLSKKTSEEGKAAMDFFSEIDFMNGVTSSEGALFAGFWQHRMMMENITNANITDGVPKTFVTDVYIPEKLSGLFDKTPPLLVSSFQYQYTDWSNDDPKAIRDKLLDFENDVSFFVPSTYASRVHEATNSQNASRRNYFYLFDHKPGFAPKPEWLKGAIHEMDLPYIFGFTKGLQQKMIKDFGATDTFPLSQEDFVFSKNMMTYWTNFAKSGNPNLPTRNDGNIPDWPTFDSRNRRYMELKIRMTSESVKNHLAATRIAFWEDLVPELKVCEQESSSGSITWSATASFLYIFSILLYVTSNY